MNERGCSARVVMKYLLLHVPGVVLLALILIVVRQWVDLPSWFAWGLVGLWAAKDVVMFPFVWRYYDRPNRSGNVNSMIGVQGIVEERLAPSGYVRVHGELWQAEVVGGRPVIGRGERVRVKGMRGLTLLVQSDDGERRMGKVEKN